ncbi:hypothetical protein N7495_004605 [Penicillium taxi]|uniref:uncharacterized protein n=1 Tax=Penicillium taxi TaxID=168475 RepID=UPI0025451EAB|nr:uncharacterized protein N7495_004605 [Penicillium taxi]KAJ5899861.1 hypothetical protein N7495_004605 [Penicillium taxi]
MHCVAPPLQSRAGYAASIGSNAGDAVAQKACTSTYCYNSSARDTCGAGYASCVNASPNDISAQEACATLWF